MKCKLKIILSIILIVSLSTINVIGLQSYEDIKVFYRNIRIFVDSSEAPSNYKHFIHKGRVYVPIRFLAETLNAKVLWNSEDGIVSINSYHNFEEANPLDGERFVYGEVLSINREKRTVDIYQHIDDNTVYEDKNLKISNDVIIVLRRNSKKINLDFADLKIGDILGMVVNNKNEVRGIIMDI